MIGTIFYDDKDYTNKVAWCNANNCHVKEIEPDENGRRFKIVENEALSDKILAEFELKDILDCLKDTDYISNKLIEAETDEERGEIRQQYSELIAQRRVWREQASRIKDSLKQ